MVVPLLGMLSFPIPSMLYALDRPDAPLKARLIGTICYLASVAPLTWQFGLTGAAAAFVIGYSVMLATLLVQLGREYRRLHAR
jgi:O-antigen/teichoic acid export membrane protein